MFGGTAEFTALHTVLRSFVKGLAWFVAGCAVFAFVSCSTQRSGLTVLRPSTWAGLSDCRTTYGDPSLMEGGVAKANPAWEKANLVMVRLPWRAHAAWNPKLTIRSLQVHRLAAPSLQRAMAAIWMQAGESQAEIDRLGLSSIGGGYNWRPIRSGGALSTHAYGCAVDFDPDRNALGDTAPNFALPQNRYVIEAFRTEGWRWGGAWPTPDGMHFQAP